MADYFQQDSNMSLQRVYKFLTHQILSFFAWRLTHYGQYILWESQKKRQWALQIYSRANLVASWLKGLKITSVAILDK